jgi:hypothetical protein
MMHLYESGNVFDNTSDVLKQDVPTVVEIARRLLPPALQNHVIKDIGSAGFKVKSGDIDLFIDQAITLKNYSVDDPAQAKKALQTHLAAQKIPAVVKGRNVHADIPYKTADGREAFAQVDYMIIPNAAKVADWHQHGPRGMYDDPNFKASQLFILLNSIGKALGVKVDAFGGTVLRRDNNEVVADNRRDAAKLLLNPKAKPEDLNSVATVMKALVNDPDREAKLAQARQDQAKGLLTLPEDHAPGTAAWFRKMGHIV